MSRRWGAIRGPLLRHPRPLEGVEFRGKVYRVVLAPFAHFGGRADVAKERRTLHTVDGLLIPTAVIGPYDYWLSVASHSTRIQ